MATEQWDFQIDFTAIECRDMIGQLICCLFPTKLLIMVGLAVYLYSHVCYHQRPDGPTEL
jgi:hypothetical protein